MSPWPLWAVLAPGEPARLESRVLAIAMPDWDEEDGEELPFEVIPGSGRYHAIVGTDPIDIGAEMQIAEALSLECDEPVYSIERANDPWTVMSWRNGALEVLEVGPDGLAKSLGCSLPGRNESSERAARKPLRTVALIEGVQAKEAHRALEEDHGEPLSSGRYRLKDTPRGLLLSGGTGGMNFAHITLSERFPHATVYGVTASPTLDVFSATVIKGGEGIEEFSQPPQEFPPFPVTSKIKGESSPERILAALGIPAEWFRNQ
ncbi:hypothetical protein [Cystobacter ferrugineus]|uniref:Uncharacterized protein n=1 Tax=Cystobacter ferrugineus TaxID=83449 RepID=A0A1L9BAQ4_9BACT|nr:hypothetical protein [Cystobacter ferrugineus]OJH39308.1 hypothetical protein BON30_17475 [Cystobacter ferrugineus]